MAKGEACGQAEGVRYEIDAGDEVQFGFPVEGEVDGGIGKFVVQADDPVGPNQVWPLSNPT